jgi:hypothetical protein
MQEEEEKQAEENVKLEMVCLVNERLQLIIVLLMKKKIVKRWEI